MTRTRQLIIVLAIVAVIAVAALFFLGTPMPSVLSTISGGIHLTAEP